MRKTGVVSSVAASLLAIAIITGGGPRAEGPSPPTNLKKVGDHWTAWDPPPPASGAYIIQKGDTLWDLSGEWLGDPFLWPQIWDENRYILDSHWIYPGDPLVVPGKPTVVPGTGELPGGTDTSRKTGGEDRPDEGTTAALTPRETSPPSPQRPPLVPVADSKDLECSGYIDPEYETASLRIAGGPTQQIHRGTGDVIYISQGKNQGLRGGDEFAILRPTREIRHPATRDKLGQVIRRMGRARVMITQENTSTAVITMACEDIRQGDQLVPWRKIPIPRRAGMPEVDRYDVTPAGGPTGYIVAAVDNIQALGTGHVIYTDLGLASGVRPGDALRLYEEVDDLPRILIGQAVVLTVEPLTSTVKITGAWRETGVGGRVELER